MITLDTTSLDSGADEIYSVERGSRVKVFLGDELVRSCVYVNVTKGVAICVKRDLAGAMIVAGGDVVYELVFGNFTIEKIDTEA